MRLINNFGSFIRYGFLASFMFFGCQKDSPRKYDEIIDLMHKEDPFGEVNKEYYLNFDKASYHYEVLLDESGEASSLSIKISDSDSFEVFSDKGLDGLDYHNLSFEDIYAVDTGSFINDKLRNNFDSIVENIPKWAVEENLFRKVKDRLAR